MNTNTENINSNNGGNDYATKYDLNRAEKRLTEEIHEVRERVNEHSQAIIRLEAVYASLERLPETITNLDKTIAIMGKNLDSMDKNLVEVKENVTQQGEAIRDLRKENQSQTENIQKIDNKSKIDWAVFITNNFWKIFAVLGIVYIVVRFIIDGGAVGG